MANGRLGAFYSRSNHLLGEVWMANTSISHICEYRAVWIGYEYAIF
jgi:hypothetical protein